jgi:hypothetical protein
MIGCPSPNDCDPSIIFSDNPWILGFQVLWVGGAILYLAGCAIREFRRGGETRWAGILAVAIALMTLWLYNR